MDLNMFIQNIRFILLGLLIIILFLMFNYWRVDQDINLKDLNDKKKDNIYKSSDIKDLEHFSYKNDVIKSSIDENLNENSFFLILYI